MCYSIDVVFAGYRIVLHVHWRDSIQIQNKQIQNKSKHINPQNHINKEKNAVTGYASAASRC